MSKYFITFSGGSQNYYDAGNRLLNQANNLNIFDRTILYTDDNLKNDLNFWPIHSNFITNNNRGYGYWLWKPYIIKKTMEMMNDNDILLYLDCGCELHINKLNIMSNFFNEINSYYIYTNKTKTEKQYNKMDLLLKFDANNPEYLNSRQNEAGAIMFLVCNKTRELVNRWYELACDYHNIDDSPSINQNLSCFIEHRHDQSIFSLLVKQYNLHNNISICQCIYYIRNKTGITQINEL
jgi:hypothetical protein